MNLSLSEAEEYVQDALDETYNSVSGGALSRNGEMSEQTHGVLSFLVSVILQSTTTSNHVTSPADCSICSSTQPKPFIDRVLDAPFTSRGTYAIPISSSHEEVPCSACQKTGELLCSNCNGNGRARCERCQGEGSEETVIKCECTKDESQPDAECPNCGGRGKVWVEEVCRTCDGAGHIACGNCNESGLISCDHCLGEGFRHQYQTRDHNVQRFVDLSDVPDSWDTNYRKIGAELTWTNEELVTGKTTKQEIAVQTKPREAIFFTVKYGEEQYNVAIVDGPPKREVVWDPSTSYPETSFRRKLGDLKSRIFW